jgi:hypothetical protein
LQIDNFVTQQLSYGQYPATKNDNPLMIYNPSSVISLLNWKISLNSTRFDYVASAYNNNLLSLSYLQKNTNVGKDVIEELVKGNVFINDFNPNGLLIDDLNSPKFFIALLWEDGLIVKNDNNANFKFTNDSSELLITQQIKSISAVKPKVNNFGLLKSICFGNTKRFNERKRSSRVGLITYLLKTKRNSISL